MRQGEAHASQPLGQLRDTASHPFLFTLGAPCHLITEHFFQCCRYRGESNLRPLPSFDGLADLRRRLTSKEIGKLTTTACNGPFTKSRDISDLRDTPVAEVIRLDGSEQP